MAAHGGMAVSLTQRARRYRPKGAPRPYPDAPPRPTLVVAEDVPTLALADAADRAAYAGLSGRIVEATGVVVPAGGLTATEAVARLRAEVERLRVENGAFESCNRARQAAETEVQRLTAVMAQDDQRLREASAKVGEPPFGCDTADHLADCILEARAEFAELKAEVARLKVELELVTSPAGSVGAVIADLRAKLAEAEGWRDEAFKWIAGMMADLVDAGFRGGDRTIVRENLLARIKELDDLKAKVAAAGASDEQ